MLTHVGAGDSQEADGVAVVPPKHCFVHEFSVERVFREKLSLNWYQPMPKSHALRFLTEVLPTPLKNGAVFPPVLF